MTVYDCFRHAQEYWLVGWFKALDSQASQLTVWEVLKRKKLVLTASALPVLYDRLKVLIG